MFKYVSDAINSDSVIELASSLMGLKNFGHQLKSVAVNFFARVFLGAPMPL